MKNCYINRAFLVLGAALFTTAAMQGAAQGQMGVAAAINKMLNTSELVNSGVPYIDRIVRRLQTAKLVADEGHIDRAVEILNEALNLPGVMTTIDVKVVPGDKAYGHRLRNEYSIRNMIFAARAGADPYYHD